MKPSDREIAATLYQSVIGRVLPVIAVLYLAAIWLDCATKGVPEKILPRPLAYFAQVAGLFPSAAQFAIEYRAEGWSCRDQRWFEVDTRPDFPIDAGNKENRFERLLHFHREDRVTMRALEQFLIARHNQHALDAAAAGQSPVPPIIGGIRTLSLRIPLGKPGEPGERYERRPLEAYPAEYHKNWYYTPESKRQELCKKLAP